MGINGIKNWFGEKKGEPRTGILDKQPKGMVPANQDERNEPLPDIDDLIMKPMGGKPAWTTDAEYGRFIELFKMFEQQPPSDEEPDWYPELRELNILMHNKPADAAQA